MGASRQSRHLSFATLLGAIAISIAAATPAAAQSAPRTPQPKWCLPFAMMQDAYEGDLDRALAHSEQCVAAHMRWVDPGGNWVLDTRDPNYWERAVGGFWALAFLCANAQLHAMAGSIAQAERALERAERFENFFMGFRSDLVDQTWRHEMMAATRGFVFERSGRLLKSVVAYRSAGRAGASRLAVLALAAKEDDSAGMWTRMAGDTPTALAVSGALAELRGNEASAFLMYYNSDRVMRQAFEERPTNAQLPAESVSPSRDPGAPVPSFGDFQPMLLTEHSRVIKALARFGKAKPAPPVQASAILRDEQEAFNKWIQESARKVPGVAFRPQYPRFFVGFSREDREAIGRRKVTAPSGYDTSVILYLPDALAITGILDRDTLAIDFYRLAVDVLSLAAQSGVTPAQLLSTGQPAGASPERLVLLAELRSAFVDLANLHRVLQNVPLRTAGGQVHTAWDEARLHAQWQQDFATARLEVLTEEFAKSIDAATSQVRDRLKSARRFVQ